jgi:hypothetical protein
MTTRGRQIQDDTKYNLLESYEQKCVLGGSKTGVSPHSNAGRRGLYAKRWIIANQNAPRLSQKLLTCLPTGTRSHSICLVVSRLFYLI